MSTQASTDTITVSESTASLPSLVLQSTLPIICTPPTNTATGSCELSIGLELEDEVGVMFTRQGSAACVYVITSGDWKPAENLAYSLNASLRVSARQDPFMTSTRYSKLHMRVLKLPLRTVNGQVYPNMWDGYTLPSIQVWYDMAWYLWHGMVWYGMVWCGVVWCGVVCGVVWRGVAWRGVAWRGVA